MTEFAEVVEDTSVFAGGVDHQQQAIETRIRALRERIAECQVKCSRCMSKFGVVLGDPGQYYVMMEPP